jgi:hypothetical protein
MAISESQLKAMEDAYYAGLKSVSFAGRTLVYQDMDALWRAIQIGREELKNDGRPDAGRVRPMRFSTLRGY